MNSLLSISHRVGETGSGLLFVLQPVVCIAVDNCLGVGVARQTGGGDARVGTQSREVDEAVFREFAASDGRLVVVWGLTDIITSL